LISRLVLIGLAALALVLVGCDAPPRPGASPTPNEPSGIRGTVLLGPTCPVGEPGSTDPISCLTPYAAQLVILDGDNEVVGRVTSGADGTFEVALPPGDYVITPVGGDPYPIAQPVPVVVTAGEFTEVQVNYDTGIR
jgi:hypothetical protein